MVETNDINAAYQRPSTAPTAREKGVELWCSVCGKKIYVVTNMEGRLFSESTFVGGHIKGHIYCYDHIPYYEALKYCYPKNERYSQADDSGN